MFVVPPEGEGTRILYLEGGEWSTDSAAQVSVSTRVDLWTVTVEQESYEIPEAVITGD